MKSTTLARIIELISASFILLFVYTALSKIWLHQSFLVTIEKSPLIGFAASLLSWAIPVMELVIALLLFLPAFRKEGLRLTFFLMSFFTVYIAYMLSTSSHLPCSCGGIISSLSWWQHLWLNVILTSLAYVAHLFSKRLKILLQ